MILLLNTHKQTNKPLRSLKRKGKAAMRRFVANRAKSLITNAILNPRHYSSTLPRFFTSLHSDASMASANSTPPLIAQSLNPKVYPSSSYFLSFLLTHHLILSNVIFSIQSLSLFICTYLIGFIKLTSDVEEIILPLFVYAHSI